MNTLVQQLTDIGLQEREAKTYQALLVLGDSTVLPIAKKAGLQRTYVYDILDLLEKKGLVSHFEKNGRRRYVAEDPSVIEALLKKRVATFADALPELKALFNATPTKPRVKFYEGKEEVQAIYEGLTRVEAYDCIYSHPHVVATWGSYSAELGRRIAAKKIKVRELLAAEQLPPYNTHYQPGTQEIRLLPKDIAISIDFILYDQKLALISYDKEIHTVVIESPGIVNSFRSLFNYMWHSTQSQNR
jgi:sugar-specific transcriptional regulator TrmB